MRLLNVQTLTLHEFAHQSEPPYAIASHRWLRDDLESSYQDVRDQQRLHLAGYVKIQSFCHYVRTFLPTVLWLWIDTCCIDKTSSAKLQEAINSMCRWYKAAVFCLAYLLDVDSLEQLQCSVWFTRGWTLQELLVPSTVIFLNSSWTAFGYKGQCLPQHPNLPDLTLDIAEITEIPLDVLYEFEMSKELSVDLRMSWIAGRSTQRIEDMAYCLLGLFYVSMPMIYGEEDKAFNRLWREIKQQAEDQESQMPRALRRNRRRLLDYDLRVREVDLPAHGRRNLRVLTTRDPVTDVQVQSCSMPVESITDPALYQLGVRAQQMLLGEHSSGQGQISSSGFQKRPREFFRRGRVFHILWAESSEDPNVSTNSPIAMRRFVVVKESASGQYCTALPISTYGARIAPSVRGDDHGDTIIHSTDDLRKPRTSRVMPKKDRPGSQQLPIRVTPDNPSHRRDENYRINYGTVHTVDHNIKAESLGMVSEGSLLALENQFQAFWSRKGGSSSQTLARIPGRVTVDPHAGSLYHAFAAACPLCHRDLTGGSQLAMRDSSGAQHVCNNVTAADSTTCLAASSKFATGGDVTMERQDGLASLSGAKSMSRSEIKRLVIFGCVNLACVVILAKWITNAQVSAINRRSCGEATF